MPRYAIHYSFKEQEETYDYIFEITAHDKEAAISQLKRDLLSNNITEYEILLIEEIK